MDTLQCLKTCFGHDSFRPGQEAMADALLSGRDALGVMPTGAGKSVCYQVPAAVSEGVALVISPLISLMKDQVSALGAAGIPAAFLNSTLTQAQMDLALKRAAQGKYKLIYVAPERLSSPSFLTFAKGLTISLIAVDEAHCVSQWGQDFRPDYLRIADFVDALPVRPPVGAFTATATERVREDIVRLLRLRDPVSVTTGFDRENLFWEVLTPRDRFGALVALLRRFSDRSGIVYCQSRKNVESVTQKLCGLGFAATRYHAGLSEEERRRNQEDFQFDRSTVMVATNAFGMGIDKSNVGFVIHYGMPRSIEAYYQEAGRAGRDGEEADCVLLYSRQDIMAARYLMEHAEPNALLSPEEQEQVRKADTERLNRMIRYAESRRCLRGELLRYFGQKAPDKCGKCANCAGSRFFEAARAAAPAKQKPEKMPVPDQVDPEKEDLWIRLKARRMALAQAQNIPPYIICDDKTLRGITAAAPVTNDQLLRVKGMGAARAERYGEQFLSVVKDWLRVHPEFGGAVEDTEEDETGLPSPEGMEPVSRVPLDAGKLALFARCRKAGLTARQTAIVMDCTEEELDRYAGMGSGDV